MTELSLSSGGRRLDAELIAPEGPASGAGLLFVHGLGSSQRGYLERAAAAADQLGCTCVTFDLSGHGASEGNLVGVQVPPRPRVGRVRPTNRTGRSAPGAPSNRSWT